MNFQVNGQDPPILPAEKYPDWIRGLTLPTLTELRKKDELTLDEERRYWKLTTRAKIKENALMKKF